MTYIIQNVAILFLSFSFLSCTNESHESEEYTSSTIVTSQVSKSSESIAKDDTLKRITKTDAQWRNQLTSEQYFVSRKAGTERAFSNKYWDNKQEGVYHCIGCNLPLFSSTTKYKSGTGWPSFYEPLNDQVVTEVVDKSIGWARAEVVCTRCDGHLGHVFEDGPKPTGIRYCLNSAALSFEKK